MGKLSRLSAAMRAGGAIALTAAAGTIAVLAPAAPAAAEPAAPPCFDAVPAAADALAMAKRCDRRVEVTGLRTGFAQVFANPAGTVTSEQTVDPRWVKRQDGTWADIDPTLRLAADGSVVPTASMLPMAFSGGGTGAFARLTDAGNELALSWPGTLPKPTLDGATATYAEVLPGVDLQVTASARGFSEVLVVKNRTAAANPKVRNVKFKVATKGVTVAASGGGALEARDGKGKPVFVAPAPLAWDSSTTTDTPPAEQAEKSAGAAAAAAPGRVRKGVMPVSVAGGELSLTPDAALLDDPGTQYPVYVDPSWTGGISGNAWTSVWSRSDTVNSSFWQNGTALNNASTKGGAGAGRTEDCTGCTDYIIRSMFRMDISGVIGKQVTDAKFRVQQRHSWTCNPASNAKVWVTGGISPSTTWNNQPSWDGARTAETLGNRRDGGGASCLGAGDIEFGVTGLVQYAQGQGWPDLTLGLRAVDEGSLNHWKRFNAGSPVLAITYNTPPNTPDQLTVDGKPCVAGAGRPFVPTATPTLRARNTDNDGEALTTWFAWARWDTATSTWIDVASAPQGGVPNGATAQMTTGTLAENQIYTFRAQSTDPNGAVSPVTNMPGSCEWQVDLTNPAAATVTGDVYKLNSTGCAAEGCGGVGQTGAFTFSSSADVTSFKWGFTDPPTQVAQPAALGGSVTVNWTPVAGGPVTLYVQAIDRAGRTATRTYPFTVAGLAPPAAHWRLADSGGTTLADEFGARPATLAGGSLGQPGRLRNGAAAVRFDGTAGNGATAPAVFDTSRSFSVSAWVRLADTASDRVVFSAAGTNRTAFSLRYSAASNRWTFDTVGSDTAGATALTVFSDGPPAVGKWTHLAAVYDAANGQQRIYVNGVEQISSLPNAKPFKATGAFGIGRTPTGAVFNGWVADAKVWPRRVLTSELASLVDPRGSANVGEWHMDSIGETGPEWDASGMYNDLNFFPVVSIPTTDAGKVGTGMRLDGVTGHARTDNPVVHTDQSFTVSGWVKLTDNTTSRTAFSQQGTRTAAFAVKYDKAIDRWSFVVSGSDVDAPAVVRANSFAAPQLNAWTYLAAVYDAQAGKIRLYVNEQFQAETAVGANFDAAGPFNIGRTMAAGAGAEYFKGDIDEVQLVAGAVQYAAGTVPINVPLLVHSGLAGKCMDNWTGGTADGNQVTSYGCNGGYASQLWTMPGDSTIRIAGKCLDVPNSSTTPGAKVQLWTCNGGAAQVWQFGAGNTLRNPNSGLCLDVTDASTADGARLQTWTCAGNAAQQWTMQWTGIGLLRSGIAGKCADNNLGALTNGNPIQSYDCNGGGNSQIFTMPGDGTLRVAGKCVDIVNYGTANMSKIHLWDCNGTTNQLWQVGPANSLRNPVSGRCLDLPNSSTANLTQLWIYDCNGTAAQVWLLGL
ncbi:ricin-type beta-trefoil lectin domain protein [Dactylosporangium sp. NPDC000521]|uniref:ricin-type beta-trefoil lectin domain protein n=1 Tax=Dactylosporangium sp. NPDC000521 TaxID=3363975 RepID=UPI00368E5DCF